MPIEVVTDYRYLGIDFNYSENNDIVEKRHLKLCRMHLRINNKISKCIVHGELGRTHLQASIDKKCIEFGGKIVNANDQQFSTTLYHVMYKQNRFDKIRLYSACSKLFKQL